MIDEDLGSALPIHRADAPRHYWISSPPLAPRSYPDAMHWTFTWTAPRTGEYVISNSGAGPRSAIAVRLEHCGGPLAPPTSDAFPDRYRLEEGQQVFITVWGEARTLGAVASTYHLQIFAASASEEAACGDRRDNDGNGVTDCAEAMCASTPVCTSGIACADQELGSNAPGVAEGPERQDFFSFFELTCGPQQRPEWVVRWTAPAPGRYVFHASGPAYTIALRSGCTGPELACDFRNASFWPSNERPVIVRDLVEDESLLVVIQAADSDDDQPLSVPNRLFVHPWVPAEDTAELCSDGRDNDGNGRSDEFDPSCPNYVPR